jgi:hypothetical protein
MTPSARLLSGYARQPQTALGADGAAYFSSIDDRVLRMVMHNKGVTPSLTMYSQTKFLDIAGRIGGAPFARTLDTFAEV